MPFKSANFKLNSIILCSSLNNFIEPVKSIIFLHLWQMTKTKTAATCFFNVLTHNNCISCGKMLPFPRIVRLLSFYLLIVASFSRADDDVTTTTEEPQVVKFEHVKIFQRQYRIILESGQRENCFSVEVDANQHLNVEYTVRYGSFLCKENPTSII